MMTMSVKHEQRDRPPCFTPGDEARRSRRLATMQCNPGVAGLAVVIVLVLMGEAEIRAHETGIIQALRGAAAGILTVAVLGALTAMARWVQAQDAPQLKTGHVMPLTRPADEFARPHHGKSDLTGPRVQRLPADPAMAAMAADADALRDGQLDFVFASGEKLFELDGRDCEGEDAI